MAGAGATNRRGVAGRLLAGHDPRDISELRLFVDHRRAAHNLGESLPLTLSLLSEVNRDFELFWQTASEVEAVLGRSRAGFEARMANRFRANYERTRAFSLSLTATF